MSRFSDGDAESGLSLIEVLVALVILAMVAVSVLTIFSFSMKLNTSALDYSRVTHGARDKMEELLATAWYEDLNGSLIMDPQLRAGVAHRSSSPGAGVQLVWKIRNFVLDPVTPLGRPTTDPQFADMKMITLTAISESGSGVGRRNATLCAMKVRLSP